jgi:lambda repressor-like predicted transcriptional regulator
MNTTKTIIPHPADFRPWVQDCLAMLGVSAASISRQLGLGRNTVGDFLGKPGRSIDMTTAHVLACKIHEIAVEKSVVLPRIGGDANG